MLLHNISHAYQSCIYLMIKTVNLGNNFIGSVDDAKKAACWQIYQSM